MEALAPHFAPGVSDTFLVHEVDALGRSERPFFRGGQAHGSLKKTAVGTALNEFLQDHAPMLACHIKAWTSAANSLARASEVRAVASSLQVAAKSFKANTYWRKRFLEIVILAGVGGVIAVFPSDIDYIADIWPLGPGTIAALKMIFRGISSEQHLHEALRVLQRALGRGQRAVPITRVSAFCCFWKRALDGSISWPVYDAHTTLEGHDEWTMPGVEARLGYHIEEGLFRNGVPWTRERFAIG
jgi:hypothetical protein